MLMYFEALRVEEMPNRTARTVQVQGKKIAIVRVDDRYHAVDALCTHMGVPLEKGTLDGNELVCPWHSARFCVQTGVKKSGPGWCDLATYPVRVTEGLVEIGLTIDLESAAPEAFPGLEPAAARA